MSLTGIHHEGNFAKGTVEYLLLVLQHGSLRDCLEAREKLKLIYSFCLIVKLLCKVCNSRAFSEQREQVFFCRCNKKLTLLNMETQTPFEKLQCPVTCLKF